MLSTIGLAMINTTGIAQSDTTQDPEIRPTGAVLGSSTGFSAVAAANTTAPTDPTLAEDQRRFEDHQYVLDTVAAQETTALINQRNAEIAAELERIEAARWVRPIEAPVTQRFSTARNHMGVDFGGAYGIPVYAAHRGEVIYAGWMTGFGYLVQIRHENDVVTYYGHLSRIDVQVGQRVATGEQIGKQGNTGRSTGPHLHFEVHLNGPNGTEVDPLAWLEGHGVTY